jgi:hypothetical protein
MVGDKDSGGQIGRQAGRKPGHGFDPSGGEPNNYDIMTGHWGLSEPKREMHQ